MEKTADAFRTISEVAEHLDLPQHVLRFWETRFAQIRPLKRGGGRRYYRPEDVDLLRAIRRLLYGEGYTIKGVQKILKEQGARGVIVAWRSEADLVPVDELPVEVKLDAAPQGEPMREIPIQNAREPRDFAFEKLHDAVTAPAYAGESGSLGPADYKILEGLLAELDECGRLLDNARRPANSR
ncbi:MAG: MerR family transcriptional regulator [Methylovirgula sp.]|nr:MerR family transcriptional regulator [Methylovirgula sp.]